MSEDARVFAAVLAAVMVLVALLAGVIVGGVYLNRWLDNNERYCVAGHMTEGRKFICDRYTFEKAGAE